MIAIGFLMFIVGCIWMSILYNINQLNIYLNCYESKWFAAARLLRFIGLLILLVKSAIMLWNFV